MAEVDGKKKLSMKKRIAYGIVVAVVAAVCWALANFFGIEVSQEAQDKAVETGTALAEKVVDATDDSAYEVTPIPAATSDKEEAKEEVATEKAPAKAKTTKSSKKTK